MHAALGQFQSSRPVRGATIWLCPIVLHARYFNPRAPCGARHHICPSRTNTREFQSSRPVRGATLLDSPAALVFLYFNPRAPCGARQHRPGASSPLPADFNPRAPCGARRVRRRLCRYTAGFQSARPVRGATMVVPARQQGIEFQSARPVRGATFALAYRAQCEKFQSARPVRGATSYR